MKHSEKNGSKGVYEVEELRKYKRVGKCDPQKCKAACCRVLVQRVGECSKEYKNYLRGFVKIQKVKSITGIPTEVWVFQRVCKYLDEKTMKCSRYKRRPYVCKEFPLPHDYIYQVVQDVCTYKFIPDDEAKNSDKKKTD